MKQASPLPSTSNQSRYLGSSIVSSVSHGSISLWDSCSALWSPKFVCPLKSISTVSCDNLLRLLEWIHPSIDQECSHADAEHATPAHFLANHARPLKSISPVCSHTTFSIHVSIQLIPSSASCESQKAPYSLTSSPTSFFLVLANAVKSVLLKGNSLVECGVL